MRNPNQTLNRLRVLKAIRRRAPISRSELPALTGLSGGSITQLAAELLRSRLIVETREPGSRPGRPRTYLDINSASAIVIGAGIERGRLVTTFVDLRGKQLFARNIPTTRAPTLAALAEQVAEALAEAIAASPFRIAEITRVALAIPGVLDSERGTVHFMATLPPGPVAFAEIIARRLGLPVTIENDQACMARAEHWFGQAQALDTFTLVHVGLAVGSAQYADGLPKSGATGLNPEIGHVKVETGPDARPCYCGARGCLTTHSGMYGLLRAAGMLPEVSVPDPRGAGHMFEALLGRAADGDGGVIALLEKAGRHLAIAVANHVTATDPGNVLISMRSPRYLERIREPFLAVLAESTMPGVRAANRVEFIVAAPKWRQGGAAALALERTYLGTVL